MLFRRPRGGGLTLIVEADDLIRQMLASVLEGMFNIRTALAADDQQAVRLVAQERPSVIVIDATPPGGTAGPTPGRPGGLLLVRRLRQHVQTRQIPIIALTRPGEGDQALAEGANEYLDFPPDLNRLAQTIQPYVRGASSAQQDVG